MQETIQNLTSINDTGKFDVLPHHANFITLAKEYVILRQNGKSEKKINLEVGVMRVKDNAVELFLGIDKQIDKG